MSTNNMIRIVRRSTIIGIFFVMLGSAFFVWSKYGLSEKVMKLHPVIDQEGAVKIAEAYIDEKGYADPFPRLNTMKMLGVPFPGSQDVLNNVLYNRSNFLEPKPIGISPPCDSFDRWTVGFRRTDSPNIDQKSLGFAIYVDQNFREIEEGRDVPIIFSKMKTRLRP